MNITDDVLVIREGGALRTAEELACTYVSDAEDLGVNLSEWARVILDSSAVKSALGRWKATDEDMQLRFALETLVNQVEEDLGMLGIDTEWNDGYVLRKVPTDD